MIYISIKALKDLGITLYNRQGEMKPLPVLIEELKDVYHKINPESKPLLTIELQDETAAPKVFYEGKEITNKVRVSFDWETNTDVPGGTKYNIEHVEVIDKEPILKGIGLARGKYGCDQ